MTGIYGVVFKIVWFGLTLTLLGAARFHGVFEMGLYGAVVLKARFNALSRCCVVFGFELPRQSLRQIADCPAW